jgi:hypothetical protein
MLLIKAHDFWRVGGYNTRITVHGYEDDEIKEMLVANNVKLMDADTNLVYHLPHDEHERIKNQPVNSVWEANEISKKQAKKQSEVTRKSKLPGLIIVGAGKCGTTSMIRWLAHHTDTAPIWGKGATYPDGTLLLPRASSDTIVEPNFFDRDKNWNMGIDWYKTLFQDDGLAIEKTPAYLMSPCAWSRMKKTLPKETRYLVMLRDPVKRFISEFWQKKREIKEGIAPYWIKEDFNQLDKPDIRTLDTRFTEFMLRGGEYFWQVSEFMRLFGGGKVKVVLFEDLKADPQGVFNEVCTFADLPEREIGPKTHYNDNKLKPQEDNSDPELVSWLKNYYRPHTLALEKLLNRDLPWNK